MKLTKKEAKKEAKKLAKRLNNKLGGKWKANVWNSLGWCYNVTLGSISVYEYHYTDKTTYSALISSEMNVHTYGLSAWTENDNPDTPEQAVKDAMENAENYVLGLVATLHDNDMKLEL